MSIKVGINGYGRIGRNILRALYESGRTDEIQVIAINDLGDAATNAHLTKYDTAHGRFPGEVSAGEGKLIVDGDEIRVLSERNPADLPWGDLDVDVVIESTGLFASKEKASAHLDGGAKKVVISAPGGNDVDATIVYGVNHETLKASDQVISNASCTTNCLAPMAKVLHDSFGLKTGLISTVHAYTNDQRLADVPHKDWRRSRAAAENIIPTTTGAARAVGKVLPELAGKLDGLAVRVPVADGAVVDLVTELAQDVTIDEVKEAVFAASTSERLGKILQYSDSHIVSSDVIGNPYSSVFDAPYTHVVSDRTLRTLNWYDNEWGYSNRVVDLIELFVDFE